MDPILKIFAVAATVWGLSLGASLLAIRLNWRGQRIWGPLGWSLAGLILSYVGLTRFRLTYSKTENGHGWSLDSKWFFLVSIIVAMAALAMTLWNLKKRSVGLGLRPASSPRI
jgi:hypothetical protein